FWAAESRKSGVAPARFVVLSAASFLLAVFFVPLSDKDFAPLQGEESDKGKSAERHFYLLHPVSRIRRRLRRPAEGPAQQNTRHNCGRCFAI
ncbi:MAG: hypothetical protein WAO11_01135, partial [Candidatus Acidiferrum sp.]